MTATARTWAALSGALAPPGGDAARFALLGLPEPDAAALESEHVTLFGRAGPAILPPYENVLGGSGLRELLGVYAEAGFCPDPSFRDRPDHVSVELAFLGALAADQEAAQHLGDEQRAQGLDRRGRGFFLRHVWPWVPAFFDSMAGAEGFPHHRALGFRASAFLGAEGVRLGAPTSAPRAEPPAADPACTTCGRPLGFSLPRNDFPMPPWGLVCVRCRLRTDLEKHES